MTLLLSASAHGAPLERLVMPGPLSAAHAEIEDECGDCHSPMSGEPQQQLCTACHKEVGSDIRAGTGLHGRHPDVSGASGSAEACQRCHAEHEGRDAETLDFDWELFDHTLTDFPLLWRHAALECDACHAPERDFHEADNTCSACHGDDDPHGGRLGDDCASCHSARDWQQTLFDHATTRFPLTGRHAAIRCASCHLQADFQGADTACNSCHETDDPHRGGFGTECQQCHTTQSWSKHSFDHARTGFPLSGAHRDATCGACHAPGETAARQRACHDCHASDDVHEGRNGSDCGSCHGVQSWGQTTFDHLDASGFSLRAAHARLECTACHGEDVSAAQPRSCAGCHDDPHEDQLGDSCGTCHSENHWVAEVRFDHDLVTFPLLGVHNSLDCGRCHLNARFLDAETSCHGCHAHDDIHAGRFGDACETCHNPAAWSATTFDHTADAGFALRGAHQRLTCASCHGRPVMLQASSPDDCGLCHRQDDPHTGRFGADCARCHGERKFSELEAL